MPKNADDLLRHRRERIDRHLARTERFRWRKGPINDTGALEGKDTRPHRQWSSRQLHRLGAVASHAWAGAIVLGVALGWIAYGAAAGFPRYWQTILESVTSVITVVMLFAIQHLQSRDQTVTQRKLDELLRASPQADSQLIAVEEAPDERLEALTAMNHEDRLSD